MLHSLIDNNLWERPFKFYPVPGQLQPADWMILNAPYTHYYGLPPEDRGNDSADRK